VSELLHEAAETHHAVYRITDGDDPDWASWYGDWLINLSELPDMLGRKPVRSELVYLLVALDKEYTDESPAERWEDHYALRLLDHFSSGSRRLYPAVVDPVVAISAVGRACRRQHLNQGQDGDHDHEFHGSHLLIVWVLHSSW
jgi:hypothetical protein